MRFQGHAGVIGRALPALGLLLLSSPGLAAAPVKSVGRAAFALIIGVTTSPDRDQERLRYADDDAAGYQDLFRSLGARTYLLARFDDNTRKVHPQAAAEALYPVKENLHRAVETLAAAVRQARDRGLETMFYVAYAGHGQIRDNKGYLALEDARLDSDAIGKIIAQVGSTTTHLIVDACHADFLAYGRGPGGERRPVSGFTSFLDSALPEDVGLFLSSSATGEAHEWEGFQAGVFSHEVRSGMYGAADANGDGIVSYKELAAFVARANAAVVNERYRPAVLMRPPRATQVLADLRQAVQGRVRFDGTEVSAHYYLENESGVRVLDLHNSSGKEMEIVRPPGNGRLFLKRMSDRMEFEIPPSKPDVVVAALKPTPSTDAPRGAAHLAFSALFSLAFDQTSVDQLDLFRNEGIVLRRPAERPASSGVPVRRIFRWVAMAAAVAGVATGTVSWLSARDLRAQVNRDSSDAFIERTNRSIDTRNMVTTTSYIAAGGAAVAALWLLWPSATSHTAIDIRPGYQGVALAGRF